MAAQEYYDSFKTSPPLQYSQMASSYPSGAPVLHPGPGYPDGGYKQAYPPQQAQAYPPQKAQAYPPQNARTYSPPQEAPPPQPRRPSYSPRYQTAHPIPQQQYLQPFPPLRPERSISEPPRHEHHHHRHHSQSRRERSRSRSDSRSTSRERTRDLSRTRSRDLDRDLSRTHSRDLPRSRSRDRNRSRTRSHKKKEKGSTTNTFLGAFGGGAIGDLIFPGLGTVGGALLGGWGGHEVGRSRSGGSAGRHKRDKYDEEWEEGCRRRGEIP